LQSLIPLSRRALLAGASLALPVRAAAAPFQDSARRIAALDRVRAELREAVARKDVPWASLIVSSGGRDLLVHAEGVGTGHVDVLRSATKIATVTAVMTLVQAGAVRLEDPVSRYIGSWSADKAGVRIEHLLSMTSGLPARAQSFSDADSLADAAETIGRTALVSAPGARFIYGNLGLTVAGRVAEIASGLSWDEFFETAVARPLGVHFSYVPLETGRLGGGGRTDLAGYGRLLRMHLDGGRHDGRVFLREDLIARMRAPGGSLFRNPIPETEAYGYGMGWWFDRMDGAGRPLVISDPGAWGAYPWIDLSRRYSAFLFIRKQLADGVRLVNTLRPVIEEAIDA